MKYSSETIEKMTEILSALPTIGKKTAARLTYRLLKEDDSYIEKFAETLLDLKKKVKYCSICYNYTDEDPCPICSSPNRDRGVICVVEEPSDVMAIEKTNEFDGVYHVLHGALNPLEGTGPEELKIKELLDRAKNGTKEIILALNPSPEGEATSHYLASALKSTGVKVTRLARGVPLGVDIEFADENTLSKALLDRLEAE